MLYKHNIISRSVLEPFEKIPADNKDYRKCSFVLLCTATTYKDASSVDKKITEDVLHKIYTEKGAIPGI